MAEELNDEAADFVTIPREQYERLLAAQRRLWRLEAAGVDNWEGYPGGMSDEEEDEDEW